MKIDKLSIIIPVYNEENTVGIILNRLIELDLGPIKKEIVVVDDGSTDRTPEILKDYQIANVHILNHAHKKGKGHAIRTATDVITGDFCIIQDADLEYNPKDIKHMLCEVQTHDATVVFGARNLTKENAVHSQAYYWGAQCTVLLFNFLYRAHIHDLWTCYKLMPTFLLRQADLRCKGFDFCPEITTKIAKLGYHIHEVPISYIPRSREDGKKIRPRDGMKGIWVILRNMFWSPSKRKEQNAIGSS